MATKNVYRIAFLFIYCKADECLLNVATFGCVCTDLKGNKLRSNSREENTKVSVVPRRHYSVDVNWKVYVRSIYILCLLQASTETFSMLQAPYSVSPRHERLPLGRSNKRANQWKDCIWKRFSRWRLSTFQDEFSVQLHSWQRFVECMRFDMGSCMRGTWKIS